MDGVKGGYAYTEYRCGICGGPMVTRRERVPDGTTVTEHVFVECENHPVCRSGAQWVGAIHEEALSGVCDPYEYVVEFEFKR